MFKHNQCSQETDSKTSATICEICGRVNSYEQRRCVNCWSRLSGDTIVVEHNDIGKTLGSVIASRKVKRIIRWSVGLPLVSAVIALVCLSQFGSALFISKPASSITVIAESGDWPMYQRDLSHSGFVPEMTSLLEGKVQWTFKTDKQLFSSPSIVNGRIYLTTGDKRALSLDAQTGDLLWEFSVADPINSSPAVAGDQIFFGLRNGKILSLDINTGLKIWEFDTGTNILSSPAVEDGVLYIASGNGKLYALDALTGEERWNYMTNGWISSSPTITESTVAITSFDTDLHVVDKITGKRQLDFYVSAAPRGSASLGKDFLFIGDALGRLKAVDWSKKKRPLENALMKIKVQLFLWGMIDTLPYQKGFIWSAPAKGAIYGVPVVADGKLIVATFTGQVVAVNQFTGDILWEFNSGIRFLSSPSATSKSVFVGDIEGNLYALDIQTGRKRWEMNLGHYITATPVPANGMLYLASWDGHLYAIK